MSILWAIWEITVNVIENLVFTVFLIKQLGYGRNNRLGVWTGFALMTIFVSSLNIVFTPPIIVVTLSAIVNILYAVIAFSKYSDRGKCMFWGCSCSIIAFASNGIVNNIAVRSASFPGPNILAQSTFRFEMMCFYLIIYIGLFAGLYYLSRNRKTIAMSLRARVFLLLFMLISAVIMGLVAQITILSGAGFIEDSRRIILLTAIITALLFIIIICTMVLFEYLGVLYKHNLELQLNIQQQKNEAMRYQNINDIYQEVREWKHDYHNHLLVMLEYAKGGDCKKLQDYLGELDQSFEQVGQFANTGNTTLDALIYNKMLLAKNHGTPFTYQIALTKSLAVSDLNLCSIVGNLLDNAIEASLKLDANMQKASFIDLQIITEKQMALICVSNYYNDEILYTDGEVQTSKKDFANHGLGLGRVAKLVQQEKGFLNINSREQLFVVEVLLPVKVETPNKNQMGG